MGGFTDYDWSATAPRPRRRRVAPPPPTEVWTQRIRLGPEHDEYPELVDRAKAELSDRLDRFAADCGFAVLGVAWQAWPTTEPFNELVIELRADLSPRTDGEWPSIRQALAEDLADRAAAATPEGRIAASLEAAAEATATVGERLRALRDAADIWAVRSPFASNEPLQARFPAVSDISHPDR